ncbi:apolipoprotein N-acyltransferase [Gemmobacter serpentinus]|uniref:apolipoprotein N-acyltransferase n=1 Tax=Gemmobacter serpentinus TaxID=2652247 RepID=UPI00124C9BBA|nr:apolipoprotein N-acyltransferase [Gemmobacter serpentinus]
MRRLIRDLGPAFGLGLLAAAGQAPLSLWWIALPAFAGIIAQIAAADRARKAGWRAWAAGAGYFGASLSWIVQPFLVEPEVYGWMVPFALIGMAGGLALFWALAGWLAQRLHGGALGFAAALTALEALRGEVLTGFPWAQPGHIWIDSPVGQAAAFVGANGLTLLTLFAAALPVVWHGRGIAQMALLIAAVYLGGALRLAEPNPAPTGLTFRLVQPNAEQHLKWDPDQAERLYQLLTLRTAEAPRPDLVIWPETSLPYLYDPQGQAISGVAYAAAGVPVAMGVQRLEGEAAFNSLAVMGADGRESALYDKAHLVPFGEYMPFGEVLHEWFGLRAFAARQGFGYAAGPGPRVLDLGHLGRVLPLICYEAVFPREVNAVAERPDWLLHVTNDAWFGTLTGPFQHAAQARLRAVEQGLPLVRVANTGVTQMVDARGQITAALPFGAEGALDAALPGALPPTPYHRFGETAFLLLLAGLVLLTIWQQRLRQA